MLPPLSPRDVLSCVPPLPPLTWNTFPTSLCFAVAQRAFATGTCKWFNISKGYGAFLALPTTCTEGAPPHTTAPPIPSSTLPRLPRALGFITPDDKGQPDCFVHQSAVQMTNNGFRFLKENERVRHWGCVAHFAPLHSPPHTPPLCSHATNSLRPQTSQVQYDVSNGERGVQAVNVRQESGQPFERTDGEGGLAEGGDRRREGGFSSGGPRRGGGGGGGERRPRRDSPA